MEKKIVYLSHFLNNTTPCYGGRNEIKIALGSSIEKGDSSNSQLWNFSNHVGTHVDLPFHFDVKGKNLNNYRAADWIFEKPFLVKIEIEKNQIIEVSDIFNKIPFDCDLLIIKTNFQKFRGEENYWNSNPGLSPELANFLKKERPSIKCLGFDFISITSYSNRPLGKIAHKAFLGEENGKAIRVIEDMKLDEIVDSPKKIIVAPVLVDGADGAPVTVIAYI